MDIFEDSENPDNVRRWVALGPHHITASGAPGRRRFPGWPEAGVTDVITLQREDERPAWLPEACAEQGIAWHHAPLSGKHLAAPGDPESLARLVALVEGFEEPRRIVVHCSAGLHRTGVALYTLFRAQGLGEEEALERLRWARALTAMELTRTPRRGERLIETAERLWCAPK